jgi:hypothetical protein
LILAQQFWHGFPPIFLFFIARGEVRANQALDQG